MAGLRPPGIHIGSTAYPARQPANTVGRRSPPEIITKQARCHNEGLAGEGLLFWGLAGEMRAISPIVPAGKFG